MRILDLANWALRTSHRNSPQGLNVSSMRVFDQIRDPKNPITLLFINNNNNNNDNNNKNDDNNNNVLFNKRLRSASCQKLTSHSCAPSSRLDHSMWVSWLTNQSLGRFPRAFFRFPLSQISFYHFSTLISFISFHFISSAPLVGRQPCYSQTFNKGASSRLIHPPCSVSDTNWEIYSI